jgi:hypothetical protein
LQDRVEAYHVVDTATSSHASPKREPSDRRPGADELLKAKIMRVKRIAGGPRLGFEIIAVEIS